VHQYVASVSGNLIQTFTEVETGKLNTRPQLAQALHLAKVTGAQLVIAKLDRLSRNAAFLLTLQESRVKFIAADMPHANTLTVGTSGLGQLSFALRFRSGKNEKGRTWRPLPVYSTIRQFDSDNGLPMLGWHFVVIPRGLAQQNLALA
jgi:hypothetical protein